jgi:hypothetical protein
MTAFYDGPSPKGTGAGGRAMLLQAGGADVWYIDESYDPQHVAVVAVAVPLIRNIDGKWTFVWLDNLRAVQALRKSLALLHHLPARLELHGVKLASGRGRYFRGKHQYSRPAAAAVYRWICGQLGTVLQDGSITAVTAVPGSNLYGHTRVEACLYALFQRMQRTSQAKARNGFVFFDGHHGNYRTMFRKAARFLPTGSSLGGWPGGQPSQNMPMDLFVKDGNFKDSKYSHFIQIADLAAYALLMKLRAQRAALKPWQVTGGLGTLYDTIPIAALNTRASRTNPQGIVQL